MDLNQFKGYTPGPWRWDGTYLLQDVPARDGGCGKESNPFSTPAGRPIADDGSAEGEYHAIVDIRSADARLIAAAPDLLELARLGLELAQAVWEAHNANFRGADPITHKSIQLIAVEKARTLREKAGEL